MTKYLALTIGPIGRTLAQTRKTRHLWAGSYLFSYLMKQVLEKYHARTDVKILLPHVEQAMFSQRVGAGLFSDRCLLKIETPTAEHDYFEEMKTNISDIVEAMNEKISGSKENATSDLKNFFQTYFLETELDDSPNAILELTAMLDSMEQQPIYRQHDFRDDFAAFLDDANGKVFYSDAGIEKAKGFRSIPEISAADLRVIGSDEFDKLAKADDSKKSDKKFQKDSLIASLQRKKREDGTENPFSEHFKNYHKYIAIVKADGDNIGKTVSKIGNQNPAEMHQFQKALAQFAQKSLDLIRGFDGAPVFAGGDDLLFFAPVANRNRADCPTIFHLVRDLDKLFEAEISNLPAELLGNPRPTISFGVSVSFYKFPMGEALEKADELLQHAKDAGKNSVAFSLQKHSQGRADEDFFIWKKNHQAFRDFLEKDGLLAFYSSDERNRLHSVKFAMLSQQAVLKTVFADEQHSEERLRYFFKANFNEREHRDQHEGYLTQVREFTHQTLLDHHRDPKKTFETLRNALDFVQFVNASDQD
jgi:CRISPR-associated protein Cmr2